MQIFVRVFLFTKTGCEFEDENPDLSRRNELLCLIGILCGGPHFSHRVRNQIFIFLPYTMRVTKYHNLLITRRKKKYGVELGEKIR